MLDSPEPVREFYARAARQAVINLYTVGSVTYGLAGQELTDFAALKEAGVVGFSDDGNPVDNPRLMRQALQQAGRLGLPVIAHAGDLALVADTIVNEGAAARSLGLTGMPTVAEDIHVARDVLLAELTGQHLHIQHVSSATAVAIIRAAKARGVKVTAEAGPHHFTLTDEALVEIGTNAKMTPPLRTPADVAAVRQGLADGTLDAIATDHAPHTAEEKAVGLLEAPCGIVGLETALGLVWTELVKPCLLYTSTENLSSYQPNTPASWTEYSIPGNSHHLPFVCLCLFDSRKLSAKPRLTTHQPSCLGSRYGPDSNRNHETAQQSRIRTPTCEQFC